VVVVAPIRRVCLENITINIEGVFAVARQVLLFIGFVPERTIVLPSYYGERQQGLPHYSTTTPSDE
jgi:hypothetical protein